MESSNMNSRSSFQWLCGVLIIAFIHGISCDLNSACLTDGSSTSNSVLVKMAWSLSLEILTAFSENSHSIQVLQNVKENNRVGIQFGHGCTIDLYVGFMIDGVTVKREADGVYLSAPKLLLDKGGLKYEEIGNFKDVASCTPKLEVEPESLKLIFRDGEGDKSIKRCGLYMKFDHALVRHTTSSSTTTTAITTTTPPTPGLSMSHPTAPTSSPASFLAGNWHWLLIVSIVIILLLVIELIGLIVWCKRRNAGRKVPVEEGKAGKDINMVTTRTAKEVEHKPWDSKKDSSNDHPEPLSDPRNRDVGNGYENLQEFIENRPPAFAEGNATEVQKKTPVDEEQYQNLQQVIEGGPPAFGGGIATECQKS